MQKIFYFLFIFLFSQKTNSQNSYKDSVIIYHKQLKKRNKAYKDHDNDGKRFYFVQKKSEQLVSIVFSPNKLHRSYTYNIKDGKIISMQLYLPYEMMPSSRGKKMYGIFYFKDGVLVQKDLMNFPEVDVISYYQIGLKLYKRAVAFLREKVI